MKIARNTVVRFHYTLRDENNDMLESSREGEPVVMLFGHGNIVKGLEREMRGHEEGDVFDVSVPPEEGYGFRRDGWTERASKKAFANPKLLKPGQVTSVNTSDGPRPVTVVKVGAKIVEVDLNHPMAGQTLHFNIDILEVREAAPEEINHGHVHGPGGHAH